MKTLDLVNDTIIKLFLKYLIPSTCATLVTSIYILADTIIIGKGVGAAGIVAMNIVLPLFSVYFGTGYLLGIGGSVLMSFANGRENKKLANTYFTTSLVCATAFSIIYLILFNTFFHEIVTWLGANQNSIELVSQYGRVIVNGLPLFIFTSLLQAFVRNDKNPKLAMIAVVSGGILNVILDYLFVFDFGMGIGGAAAATLIGNATSLIIVLTHFISKNNTIQLNRFSFKAVIAILKSGASSFIVEMAGGIVIFVFNIQLLSYIGDTGVLVYGIISNCAIVAMSLLNGVAQAAQPIISVNFGANKINRVLEVRSFASFVAALIGVLLFLLGFLFPKAFIAVFVNPTEDILLLGTNAIRIYFIAFLMMGYNIFHSTYFQCVMQPMRALFICLLRGLILSIVLVYILPVFFGVNGIWSVMPISEFVTCIIVTLLLNKTNKRLKNTAI
jgi:putative MATE family efflux protein